jgi:uncharacterized protein (TIGR00251 family)
MPPIVESAAGSVTLAVRVIPRAAKSTIAGIRDDALLVRLVAPPVDDAANTELVRLLADTFAIPRSAVTIVSGAKARRKQVKLMGVTAERVQALVASL